MSYLLFACSVSRVHSECWSYSCKPETLEFSPGTCVLPDSETSSFYLSRCNADSGTPYCSVSNEYVNSSCTAKPVANTQSFPGETCTAQKDCAVGTCEERVCRGTNRGGACSGHPDCAPGLHCVDNLCSGLLRKGESGCLSDFDCEMSAGCNEGFCTEYLSLRNGLEISECAPDGQGGVSLLCSSGSCLRSSLFSNAGTCAESPRSVNSYPSECTTGSLCKGLGDGNVYTAGCTCGRNSAGKAFCSLFRGDVPYQDYILSLKVYLSGSSAQQCNTVRRFSELCWFSNSGGEVYLRKLYYESYPELQEADNCVRAIYYDKSCSLALCVLLFNLIV